MSSFKIFDIAGSGLSAQSVRLNTVASNLANADSVSGDPNTVYKARHPVFEAVKNAVAAQTLGATPGLGGTPGMGAAETAVRVRGIVESTAAPSERYEPGNPLANADGNVYSPNVNVIEEMTDMISASRAYQNNVEVMNTSKELMLATLKLGS
jgi:flagellar basal-body rod protein FlgC